MGVKVMRVCGHTFLAAPLNRASVVFDFGMNRGEFSKTMLQLFDCRIFGAEAHPRLHADLPVHASIVAQNVAIAGKQGFLELNVFDRHCASVVFDKLEAQRGQTISVPTMSLGDFLRQNQVEKVNLLKCDIEGAELAMFDAASDEELKRIDQISIEFHDFLDPDQLEPVRRVFERLHKLSFWSLDFSKNRMDVLFVNQHEIPLTRSQKFTLIVTKYWRALARIMGRLVGKQDSGNTGLSQVRV